MSHRVTENTEGRRERETENQSGASPPFLFVALLLSLPVPLCALCSLRLTVFIERTLRIYCAFRVINHSMIFSLSSGDIFGNGGIPFNP